MSLETDNHYTHLRLELNNCVIFFPLNTSLYEIMCLIIPNNSVDTNISNFIYSDGETMYSIYNLDIRQSYHVYLGFSPLAAEAQKFRGGGGTGVVFACAPGLRKYKVARATPKIADERGGGTPTHFFFRTISGHHLHYWVGVPSVHNTDLRGDKHIKKKNTVKFRGDCPPPTEI